MDKKIRYAIIGISKLQETGMMISNALYKLGYETISEKADMSIAERNALIKTCDRVMVCNLARAIDPRTQDMIDTAKHYDKPIEYWITENRYPIITLCGSLRFKDEFGIVNRELTHAGYIVLTPNIFDEDPNKMSEYQHHMYDEMHQQKMDMSDMMIIVSRDRYVGDNTKEEIEYCEKRGIPFMWWEDIKDNISKFSNSLPITHQKIINDVKPIRWA